jgi:hypothetical protein
VLCDVALPPATYDLVRLGNLPPLRRRHRRLFQRLRPAVVARIAVVDVMPSPRSDRSAISAGTPFNLGLGGLQHYMICSNTSGTVLASIREEAREQPAQ